MKLIPNRISFRNPFASVHLISNYWLQPHKTNPQKAQIISLNIFLKMMCWVAISCDCWRLQSAGLTTQRKHENFFAFLILRCSAFIGYKHNAEVLMQRNNSMFFHSSYQCAVLASVSCASRVRYESRNMKSINKHSAASSQAIRLIGCARSMPRHSLFAPISDEAYAKMLLFQYGKNR